MRLLILPAILTLAAVSASAQQASVYEGGFMLDGTTYNEPYTRTLNNQVIVKSLGQQLNLTGAFLKTLNNAQLTQICKGYFYYRLYPENEQPGAFITIACDLYGPASDDMAPYRNLYWQNNGINIDVIRNLGAGTYVLETWYAASEQSASGRCAQVPDLVLQNGSGYFRALVTITPQLDIEFTEFSALTDNQRVYINWETTPVSDFQLFVLQKSSNGVNWNTIDTIVRNGTAYRYTDEHPNLGVTYYRIRAFGSGKSFYTVTKRVYVGKVDNSVTIYPNPVYRNLRFNMTAIVKGKYDIVVYNTDGTRITGTTVIHDGKDNLVTIPLPDQLVRGVYRLVIYGKYEFFKQSFLIE